MSIGNTSESLNLREQDYFSEIVREAYLSIQNTKPNYQPSHRKGNIYNDIEGIANNPRYVKIASRTWPFDILYGFEIFFPKEVLVGDNLPEEENITAWFDAVIKSSLRLQSIRQAQLETIGRLEPLDLENSRKVLNILLAGDIQSSTLTEETFTNPFTDKPTDSRRSGAIMTYEFMRAIAAFYQKSVVYDMGISSNRLANNIDDKRREE